MVTSDTSCELELVAWGSISGDCNTNEKQGPFTKPIDLGMLCLFILYSSQEGVIKCHC